MAPADWTNYGPGGLVTIIRPTTFDSTDSSCLYDLGESSFEVIHIDDGCKRSTAQASGAAEHHSDGDYHHRPQEQQQERSQERPQPRRQQRRTVSFCDEPDVLAVVPNRRDIPSQTKRQVWYHSSELKRLRQQEQQTLRKIRNGEAADEIDQESIVPQLYALQRTLHKLTAQALVLEEQSSEDSSDREQRTAAVTTGHDAATTITSPTVTNDHNIASKYKDFCSRCSHATFVSTLAILQNTTKTRQRVLDVLPIVFEYQ